MAVVMPGCGRVSPGDEPFRRRTGVPLLLLLATAMCAGDPPSRRVADRFVELYYARSNVAEAVTLSTGAARAKLEGELAAMAGMPPAAAADRPRVAFHVTSEVASGTQATYVYAVDPQTTDVKPLAATVVMTSEGGQWLVTKLEEAERGS
jgi:hypothetical protein